MKAKEKKISDELRHEYDFDYSKAVRGNKWGGNKWGSGLVSCILSSCYVIKQHGKTIKN